MIRVMIVEDDPMVAELNKRYLAQIDGFDLVGTARTGDEALALLQTVKVDLLLLDIFMPGINGLELLSSLRTAGQGVDVILVTAARDRGSIAKALQHGAIDYLIKPFELERLHAALDTYKQRRRTLVSREIFSQQELDEQFFCREKASGACFPKGLDRNTLQLVWNSVRTKDGLFSTEDMAKAVGISRVSMRKYLEYLKTLSVLRVELDYGSVGRPTYKYRCVDKQAKIPY